MNDDFICFCFILFHLLRICFRLRIHCKPASLIEVITEELPEGILRRAQRTFEKVFFIKILIYSL